MDITVADTISWYGCRVLNWVALTGFLQYWIWGVTSPYGKFYGGKSFPWSNFDDSRFDPGMNAALFNFLMEFPSLIYTFLLFPYGQHANNLKAWILVAPYVIHYLHRGTVWVYITNQKHAQRTYRWYLPLSLVITFTIAVTQTREISHYHDYDNDTWFWLRVPVGAALFVWAFLHRIPMDHYLARLKGEDGTYKIPKGGWFELVSCPHFLAELIEWIGWFIMTGSSSFLQILVYSCSVLIPRALCTHKWYLEKFEDYPKTRKALIPYLV